MTSWDCRSVALSSLYHHWTLPKRKWQRKHQYHRTFNADQLSEPFCFCLVYRSSLLPHCKTSGWSPSWHARWVVTHVTASKRLFAFWVRPPTYLTFRPFGKALNVVILIQVRHILADTEAKTVISDTGFTQTTDSNSFNKRLNTIEMIKLLYFTLIICFITNSSIRKSPEYRVMSFISKLNMIGRAANSSVSPITHLPTQSY